MNKTARAYWAAAQAKIQEYNTNGKPTVALFCESFYPSFDGVINVQTNYALRLLKDFNVVIIAPRRGQHYIQKDYLTLLCRSILLPGIAYPYGVPKLDRTFRKHLKQLRIDLVHLHGPFAMGRYGARYAKRHHLPVVGTFHAQFKKDFLRYVKFEILTRPLVRRITRVFNRCDEVWTMNQANVEILQSYGYHGATRIIPNGTDLRHTAAHDALLDTVTQEYHLPAQTPILMFCGRMVANKNIFLIAEALQILCERGFNFQMLFVGDGLDLSKLKHKINATGLTDCVTFTGRVMDREKLGALYLKSDLLIFPSLYDTDGLVKYEAAAFGTPSLLVEDSPAAVGTVDGVTAYHTANTATAVADKIQEIFAQADRHAQVCANVQTKLYQHWDDIVARVAQVYREMLAAK